MIFKGKYWHLTSSEKKNEILIRSGVLEEAAGRTC